MIDLNPLGPKDDLGCYGTFPHSQHLLDGVRYTFGCDIAFRIVMGLKIGIVVKHGLRHVRVDGDYFYAAFPHLIE